MKNIFSVALISLSLSASNAFCDLIEMDYQEAGDGKLFLDTDTNREWVDVTKTTGMSVNEFFNDSIYADQGFVLANEADLVELYTNAGAGDIALNNDVRWSPENIAAATLLSDLMEHEPPFTQTSGDDWIVGYMDIGSSTNLLLSRVNVHRTTAGASIGVNTNDSQIDLWTYDANRQIVGIWAYRGDAPVGVSTPPELGCLFIAGILAIIRLRVGKANTNAFA